MKKTITELSIVMVIVMAIIIAVGHRESKSSGTIEVDEVQLLEEVKAFISGSEEELKIIDAEIKEADIDGEIYNKVENEMVSDNAYYIRTDTNMYRFQFNDDRSKITSYIKYTIEG